MRSNIWNINVCIFCIVLIYNLQNMIALFTYTVLHVLIYIGTVIYRRESQKTKKDQDTTH